MSATQSERLIHLVSKNGLSREIEAFLIDRQAGRRSPRTIGFYSDELRYFSTWLDEQGIRDVETVTPTFLRQYLLELGKKRNPGGVHAAYRTMRAFFNWYEKEYEPGGWRNPMRKVEAPKVQEEPINPVPLPDVQAMLDTCRARRFSDERDRALLLALLDTGCRGSEFVGLDIGDLDISTGAVVVKRGKGQKTRMVFLGYRSRKAVLSYLRYRPQAKPGDALWVTAEGTRLKFAGLRMLLKRRAERANVPVPSPHDFRRAFALASLRAGADLISLQRLMGHADLSVLRRYLAQTKEDLREVHEKAGPVDNLL